MSDDDFQPNYVLLENYDPSASAYIDDFDICSDFAHFAEDNGVNTYGASTSQIQSFEENSMEADVYDKETKRRVLSLMAVNKIYLDFVNRMVFRVDRAIERNRELQTAVKAQLASRKRVDDMGRNMVTQLSCCSPYFKDFAGMAPRHNSESLRIMKICDINPLLPPERSWTSRDLQLLCDSVKNSLFENAVIPLNSRKDILLEKLRTTGVEDINKRKVWLDEIEQINRRIFYLRENPADEYFAKTNYDQVDWAKISATDFNGTRSVIQLRMKWCNEIAPYINNNEWTSDEDNQLRQLIQRPWLNWDVIAEDLGTKRTPFRCFERSKQIVLIPKQRRPWTPEEDDKLESLVQTLRVGDQIPWHKIASFIPGRKKKDCQTHYERYLNRRLKHGRWTVTEDLILLNCVNKYGPQDWPRISAVLQNRSSIQCRDRFINVLDYKRRNRPWLWEEHERLFYGIRIFGRSSYAKIALLLPGRNNVDVKHRVRALLRYKIAKTLDDSDKKKIAYNNIMPSYQFKKERRDTVLSKFRQFAGVISHFDKTGQQIDLRMGIGAFMLTPDGKPVDYTVSKKLLHLEFGKFVSTSGRWTGISRNPNEFGSEELDDELRKLPAEKRTDLLEFLKTSDVRYALERGQEESFNGCAENSAEYFLMLYDLSLNDSRMGRLNDLINEYLPIEENDIVVYNKYRCRPPKHEEICKNLSSKGRNKREIVSHSSDEDIFNMSMLADEQSKHNSCRKRKITSINISAIAPKRSLTASCRFLEEIRRTTSTVPQEERRMCIIRNLCNYIRRGDDHENVKNFVRSGLKLRGLCYTMDYLTKAVGTNEERQLLVPNIAERAAPTIFGSSDMMRVSKDELTSRRVRPSVELFKNYKVAEAGRSKTEKNFSLRMAISSLLPPCISTINAVTLLNKTRHELTTIASRLFDAVDDENFSHRPLKSLDECLDIRLSSEIVDSEEYLKVKKRMYKMLFLPMLMQMAITPLDEWEKRQSQRALIAQRRLADQAFVDAYLQNTDLHGKNSNEKSANVQLDSVVSENSCQVFKTYNNEGALSLENERAADIHNMFMLKNPATKR